MTVTSNETQLGRNGLAMLGRAAEEERAGNRQEADNWRSRAASTLRVASIAEGKWPASYTHRSGS